MQQFIDHFDFIKLSIQTLCSIIFHHLPFPLHQIKRLKGEEGKGNDIDDISVKKKKKILKKKVVWGFFKELKENQTAVVFVLEMDTRILFTGISVCSFTIYTKNYI